MQHEPKVDSFLLVHYFFLKGSLQQHKNESKCFTSTLSSLKHFSLIKSQTLFFAELCIVFTVLIPLIYRELKENHGQNTVLHVAPHFQFITFDILLQSINC